MTVHTAQGRQKMAWRKCQCPIYASQDGVCGCPQFWARKDNQHTPLPASTTSSPHNSETLLDAAITPRTKVSGGDKQGVETSCENSKLVGPPQETCFFWYHGTCHRGNDCKFAHRSHITWPITPPPGFVHFDPCYLPLCPVRADLAAVMESQQRGRPEPSSHPNGQLDGAAASFLRRDASNEGTSSDQKSARSGDESHSGTASLDATPMQSLIDPNSRPLDGSYSDSDSSEMGKSDAVTAGQQGQNNHDVASSTSQIDGMDYFDLSEYAPLSPSSDVDEPTILSLSHSGTLRKRSSRFVSSSDREDGECKRTKLGPKHELNSETPLRCEETRNSAWPDTAYPTNRMDIANSLTNNSALSPGPLHHLPPKPASATPGKLFTNLQKPSPPQPHKGIPTGPRALGGGAPVCFYWYHKGHCTPKSRNGQLIKCNYAHALEGRLPQVSLPPNIRDHDPCCPLPLCPVPRTETFPGTSNPSVIPATEQARKGRGRRWEERKKGRVSDARHNPTPRETMLGRHVVTRAGDVNGSRSLQKPLKLSGANSESVKVRKNARQRRQKDKGAGSHGMNQHRDGRSAARSSKRTHMQDESYGRLKTEASALDYGEDDLQANPNTSQTGCGSVDHGTSPSLELFNTEISRPLWMSAAQPVADGTGGHGLGTQDAERASLEVHSDSNMQTSVDDRSSTTEPRLDWDTDEVRQLFGV